ncbi:MAG: hypothetical protein M1832_003344 [Thelocarpon impressellum]|nr:MAG: hypothetical protein M1832_003344 [Thelocarpon impressellum]
MAPPSSRPTSSRGPAPAAAGAGSRAGRPSYGQQTAASGQQPAQDVNFTVFVRLPFPRRDFVDPPLVEWNAGKERALWKILSHASGGNVDDWQDLADRFEVSLPFLLQQSAWLYERQLSQVRAQMRKVGNPNASASKAGSSVPPGSGSGSGSAAGAQSMRRGGSGGAGPSHLTGRPRDSPISRVASKSPTPTTAMPQPMSRTSSASTAVQLSQRGAPSPRRLSTNVRRPSQKAEVLRAPPERREDVAVEEGPDDSSGASESSSDDPPTMRSQVGRRVPRRAVTRDAYGAVEDVEEDEEEETPAFLPFPVPDARSKADGGSSKATGAGQSPTASTASSASSSQPAAPGDTGPSNHRRPLPGPLSPRRAAELAGRSPRRRPGGRQGSDGTPSMGSSFSDLEDASVTQSALEEALLSNMQRGNGGGVASRMSSISQALRSRYL